MLRFFRPTTLKRLSCEPCICIKNLSQSISIASSVQCQQRNSVERVSLTNSKCLLAPNNNLLQQKRSLKKKKKSKDESSKKDDEEDEEEESDLEYDDGDLPLGYIQQKFDCVDNRLDIVAKTALLLQRKTVEDALNNDRMRLNGERPEKKGQLVGAGDVIDIVLGRNVENPELLDVKRIEIIDVPDGRNKNRFEFTVRRYDKLIIPNYTADPIDSLTTTKVEEPKFVPAWKKKK